MDKLTLKSFVCGDLSNNCYLIFDSKVKQGFLIDAPQVSEELKSFIKAQGLKILFVALTHAHFDHIQGLSQINEPFYIHSEDKTFLADSQLNGSDFFPPSIKIGKEPLFYQESASLDFNGHSIKIIHTPGHTPGSVSLQLGKWLFSGDALFAGSVGRTDIPLASHQVLISAIKNKLLILPTDTIVYPGHGPATTIGKERESNPFLI